MMRKIAPLFAFLLLLTSCGTSSPGLYSWYGYENRAYQHMKKQTPKSADQLMASYSSMINSQQGTRQAVPPGIYAEKGYMLVKKGKVEEGIPLLKKEMELYPESEVFISRIIKQLEE